MPTWIEMRCEGRSDEERKCWSHKNNGPMLMASDDLSSLKQGYSDLLKIAVKMKWKRTRAGWFCPVCATDGVGERLKP